MHWEEFKKIAPELAHLGEERFLRNGLALVGTIRKDGSPRISPIEPYFFNGHLFLGVMRSQKAHDLLRDQRCVIHNTVSDPNGSEGIFSLQGRVIEVKDKDLWIRYSQAYSERHEGPPPEGFPAHLFSVDIGNVAFIGWDIEKGEMIVKRWRSGRTPTEIRRKYP